VRAAGAVVIVAALGLLWAPVILGASPAPVGPDSSVTPSPSASASLETDAPMGIDVVASEDPGAGARGDTRLASTPVPVEGSPDVVTKKSLAPGVLLVGAMALATLAFVGAGILISRRS
jgi:hypothetical protein